MIAWIKKSCGDNPQISSDAQARIANVVAGQGTSEPKAVLPPIVYFAVVMTSWGLPSKMCVQQRLSLCVFVPISTLGSRVIT